MAQPPYVPQQPSQQQQPAPQCYRHPGRVTYIACQRCGRPICPECMIPAAVGYQCPECVAEGARTTRQNQGPYGGTRSKNPNLTTIVLIAINAAVWGLISLTGGSGSLWFLRLGLRPLGTCVVTENPAQFYPGVDAAACAASAGAGTWMPGVADGAVWQLVTNAFTHVDPLHIGFNMLALWFLGPQLERLIGRGRFLALYLLSALAGAAVVMWLSSPLSISMGASGAVFGMLGGLLVIAYKVRSGAFQQLLMWLGFNVAYTFLGPGSISWQGHLGGLLGGAAIAAILVYAPRANRLPVQFAGLIGVAVLTLAAIAVRIAQLA